MRIRSPLMPIVVVFALGCLLSGAASGAGEFTAGVGGTWPQGSFAAYGDPGPLFLLRVEAEVPDFEALAGWLSVGYVIFSSETFDTEATTGDIIIPLEQRNQQDALSVHVGLQLGSSSHHAFFRPRAAVGVGFYYFTTNVELRQKDDWSGEGDEEPLYREVLDSQFRFGWRGILGADFYLSPKWGVSFDIIYDHVLGLNRIEGDTEAERTSRYHGFAVGVVFPFGD